MKNIIYFEPSDATKFDLNRFVKSINNYAQISKAGVEEVLKQFDNYENLHVSRLVEAGAALIAKFGDEEKAKEYFEQYEQYFGAKFERLRRITGYLVGTLDRWNDGKKAEEAARVKHAVNVKQSVNSCLNDNVRAERLQEQALAHNVAYAA